MTSEIFTIIATLSGVIIGGSINYVASRSVKNHEWRLALARDKTVFRQKLYAEFLVEAQSLIVKSHTNNVSSLADLNPLNGKFAEISLIAPSRVVEAARALADCALTSQSASPAKEVISFSKLKETFIALSREDIASILSEA